MEQIYKIVLYDDTERTLTQLVVDLFAREPEIDKNIQIKTNIAR